MPLLFMSGFQAGHSAIYRRLFSRNFEQTNSDQLISDFLDFL